MAQEQQVGMNNEQLQTILERIVKLSKEPNEIEKAKIEKEQNEIRSKFKQAADLAKTNEEATARRRRSCAHSREYNGRRFSGFIGQVCSDGMVYPVCKFCQTAWPPFSAEKCLPDKGTQGVNMEQANPTSAQLTDLHKASFPDGCPKTTCFICHPAKG